MATRPTRFGVSKTTKNDAESQLILEAMRELCQRIRIYDYNPARVDWLKNRPGGGSKLPPDQPLLLPGRIVLAANLRGSLGPEKWRPLLAAALARKLNRKWIVLGTIGIPIGLITVLISAWFLLPIILPWQISLREYGSNPGGTAPLGSVIVISIAPLFLFLSFMLLVRWWRRRWMMISDRQAASLLGKDSLLDALKSVDELAWSTPNVSKHRGRSRQRFRLESRIARLERWKDATGSTT